MGTERSGMQRVTGVSMLSCSFRWPITLLRESQEGVRQQRSAQTLGGNEQSLTRAQASEP